ncbi:MAG: hypothetical protein ACI88C_002008 [Acidimicrobiales bacterium]
MGRDLGHRLVVVRNVSLPIKVVTFFAMILLDQISDALGASGALSDLSSPLGVSAANTDA